MASRDINYLSKDFDSIKADLIDYIKRHFPNEFSDFSDASGGMALIELLAYIGDLSSFNVDKSVNENFIFRAIEEKNVLSLAQGAGYKPKLATPSIVNLSISATFSPSTSADSMFILKKGTRVISNVDPIVSFEVLEDVDFSLTADRTVSTTGSDIMVAVSGISVVAGQTRSFTYTAGPTPTPFLKITLPDEDITEILSVSGSDNSEWFEVDYLARDTIFWGELNNTSSSANTPYVLKLKKVPKRFAVERETGGRCSIRTGAGILSQEDSEIVPNPEDFVLTPTLRGSPSGFIPSVVDSTNFLKTKTMGVAPRNIALTITYRFGGGIETNVGSNLIRNFRDKKVEFKTFNFSTISADTANTIIRSLNVDNPLPAGGGEERETLDEIRENTTAFISAQERAVTLTDYQVRVMTMPPSFGGVFRSFARKSKSSPLGVELLLMSRDTNGSLITTDAVLKNNIETYLRHFKSFNDTIQITDGKIVNLGVDVVITPEVGVNGNEAILATLLLLQKEFDINLTNFNDDIVLSNITAKIQSLQQVLSVTKLTVYNITGAQSGRTYSNVKFNPNSYTLNGILVLPEDVCWEVKYAKYDITCRIG